MTAAVPTASARLPWRPLGRGVAWTYLGAGLVAAFVLLLGRGTPVAQGVFPLVGVGTAVALFVGRSRNRPPIRHPWTLFAWGSVLFIVGGVLRQVLAGTPGLPLSDAATLSGYLACFVGFALFLRGRRSVQANLHELVDGVIVMVAGAVVAIILFTVPTVALDSRDYSAAYALLQGMYPVLDVGWLFVCVLLAWTSAVRVPAFWLLTGAAFAVLVGDVGYAELGTQGLQAGSSLLDLPYVVAFSLLGASGLHPSVAALSNVQARPVQAWSPTRLAIILPALMVPPALVLWRPTGHSSEPIVAGIGCLVLIVALLARALGAVNSYAATQRVLHRAARLDSLTGLVNRLGVMERLTELLRTAEHEGDRVDVLFLDVDGFKFVNDSWGHGLGDELLVATARRLLRLCDDTDVVARIGGDEFVIARYVSREERSGADLAACIVDAFHTPFALSQARVAVTCSLGLRSSDGHDTAEGLIRDADTALYRAKGAGRNQVAIFDPSMRDTVRQRVETELALRYALDRQEFSLHYQPVVDLATARVRGFEALLRWTHPGLGTVSPADFVPVAEETGLIVEIGAWVVTEALRQLGQWRLTYGPAVDDLYVAVNVSARQLRDPSLAPHVRRQLERWKVPPANLVIEITESDMVSDIDLSSEPLRALDAIGVRIAVDDFGTGYSSLAHLRRFPVSVLKIDRTFVDGLADDPDDGEIVRAVVGMAGALRLDLVAEGVETETQRDLLGLLGVAQAQGWLYGRPAPADEVWRDGRLQAQLALAKS